MICDINDWPNIFMTAVNVAFKTISNAELTLIAWELATVALLVERGCPIPREIHVELGVKLLSQKLGTEIDIYDYSGTLQYVHTLFDIVEAGLK